MLLLCGNFAQLYAVNHSRRVVCLSNEMIYLWGYNGSKHISENIRERYSLNPQTLTNEGCAKVNNELEKLQNFDTGFRSGTFSFLPKISFISTLKGHHQSLKKKCQLNVICQQDDTSYLIHNSGLCSVFTVSNESQSAATRATVQVSRNTGMENARFSQVAAGDMNTIGITDDCIAGRILPDSHHYIFRPFSPSISCRQISCGKEHALLLTQEGNVYSFGMGSRGQLGHGITDMESEPKLIEALEMVSIATISCGGWHSAAVSDIQDLYIWGWNESGQLGFKKPRNKERMLRDTASKSKDHIKGSTHNLNTISDQSMHDSQSGEFKDNNGVLFHVLPTILDLPSGDNVSKVSCGSRHTVALTDTGHLYTWGWGEYGQLGHGDRDTKYTPTQVQYFTDHGLTVTDIHCKDWNTGCVYSDKDPGKS